MLTSIFSALVSGSNYDARFIASVRADAQAEFGSVPVEFLNGLKSLASHLSVAHRVLRSRMYVWVTNTCYLILKQ